MINKDQNSLFILQLITKTEWHQMKLILRNIKLYCIGKIYGTFPLCDLITRQQ